jgi:hypothetical protein
MKKGKNQTPKLKKNKIFCKYLCKIIVGDRQQPEKALTINSTNQLNPLHGSLPHFLLSNYQLR